MGEKPFGKFNLKSKKELYTYGGPYIWIVRVWKICTHAANEKTHIKCLIVFSLWKVVEIPNSNSNYAMWKIGGRKDKEEF